MNKWNVKRASGTEITDTFLGLKKKFFPKGRWIGITNTYSSDCTEKLDKYKKRGASSPLILENHDLNDKHLREYIASSAPLHCADGWSFLGRAFDALLHGDTGTTTHLGYYAELRASMSLLAAYGIGVFNHKHFVVTQGGACLPVNEVKASGVATPLGTHKVIWPLLDYWMTQPNSTKLIGNVISPSGKKLNEWLDAFSSSGSQPIETKWLKAWGVDLKRLTKDREARNFASYRPTGIGIDSVSCSRKDFDFIKDFWLLFKPSQSSRFEELDKYLMREAVGLSYKGMTGDEPSATDATYLINIDSMLNSIMASDSKHVKDRWKNFILKKTSPSTPSIIEYASKSEKVIHPDYHLHVLARASILLRLATGATAPLLSTIDKTDLGFWWKSFGESRGLWEPSMPPADFNDLWSDIQDTIETMEGYSSGDWPSLNEWHASIKTPLFASSCERIALWGLRI